MSTQKIRKAVFPVGGLGTRFLPATKALPKEMLTVVDKPIIHYAFEEAKAAGIEQFIFVTGRNKNAISNHFDHSFELQEILKNKNKQKQLEKTRDWMPDAGNVVFTRQMEPLGLGHAVWTARHIVGDEPFAVLLADDMVLSPNQPCLKQMLDTYDNTGGNVVAVETIPREKSDQYGILDVECDDGKVAQAKGVVEKPKPEEAPSTLSVIGRYILQPEIFSHLENQPRGAGGEIQLTDAIAAMLPDTSLFGTRFEGRRFDCGSHEGFIEANIAFSLVHESIRKPVCAMMRRYVENDCKPYFDNE